MAYVTDPEGPEPESQSKVLFGLTKRQADLFRRGGSWSDVPLFSLAKDERWEPPRRRLCMVLAMLPYVPASPVQTRRTGSRWR